MTRQDALTRAQHTFEAGRRAAARESFQEAEAAFETVVQNIAPIWRTQTATTDDRTMAARLTADASWSAGMAALTGAENTDKLRAAVLMGVEIYERTDLNQDVRIHGLYRAQCSAFELGHALAQSQPEEAIDLFQDAANCADALATIPGAEPEKTARVLANAAAASLTASGMMRDQQHTNFQDGLRRALALGQQAVDMPDLRGSIEAETMLVLADASYELALTTEDQPEAASRLKEAVGWTQEATEAPGADAVLQAQAMLRGANYACVFGLYQRHHDFEEGLDALEGAVELALTVSDQTDLAMSLRIPALDTALRTRQNIGLLLKERDLQAASDAFALAADLAVRAAQIDGLPGRQHAEFTYLSGNALLERAAVMQAIANDPRDTSNIGILEEADRQARAALASPDCTQTVAARAALLICGVAGRLLAHAKDEAAIQSGLSTIEIFGQRAAELPDALHEHRATGAAFAADAATKLAERSKDPRAADELKHRAEALTRLHHMLTNP